MLIRDYLLQEWPSRLREGTFSGIKVSVSEINVLNKQISLLTFLQFRYTNGLQGLKKYANLDLFLSSLFILYLR